MTVFAVPAGARSEIAVAGPPGATGSGACLIPLPATGVPHGRGGNGERLFDQGAEDGQWENRAWNRRRAMHLRSVSGKMPTLPRDSARRPPSARRGGGRTYEVGFRLIQTSVSTPGHRANRRQDGSQKDQREGSAVGGRGGGAA